MKKQKFNQLCFFFASAKIQNDTVVTVNFSLLSNLVVLLLYLSLLLLLCVLLMLFLVLLLLFSIGFSDCYW